MVLDCPNIRSQSGPKAIFVHLEGTESRQDRDSAPAGPPVNPMVPPASRECGLLVVVFVGDFGALVGGGDHLEPTVRNRRPCSFQTFPQDLVVDVGGNAVFA